MNLINNEIDINNRIEELRSMYERKIPSVIGNCEIIGFNYETDKYDMFNIVKENRSIKETHVEEIKKSMIESGGWIGAPAIVDYQGNIRDGQHRYIACKQTGFPFRFTFEEVGLNECIKLNSTSKVWKVNDYIKAYADNGNNNYIIFRDFMSKYLNVYTAQVLYSTITKDNNRSYSGSYDKTIRSGSLICSKDDILIAEDKLKYFDCYELLFDKLSKGSRGTSYRPTTLCVAILFVYDNFYNKREAICKAVLKNYNKFILPDDIPSCLAQFSDMYNKTYRSSKKIDLELEYRLYKRELNRKKSTRIKEG